VGAAVGAAQLASSMLTRTTRLSDNHATFLFFMFSSSFLLLSI
jgi:hypothetical protein